MSSIRGEAWEALLREGTRHGEFVVRDTGVETGFGPARLAIDDDSRLHLFLPVQSGSHVAEDRTSAGVQLHDRNVLDSQNRTVQVADLVCLKPHLGASFARMVDEVLVALRVGNHHPVDAATVVLEEWRALLEALRPERLSPEQQAGLFGELEIMRTIQEASLPGERWWTGHERERHDFVAPGADVEVKTTRANESLSVSINGLGQLDPPTDGRLLLALVRVEAGGGTGVTLPEIVEQVLRNSTQRVETEKNLAAAGYNPEHAAEYDQRWRVREIIWHDVCAGFPRLTSEAFRDGKVPEGVSGVRYVLDLALAVQYRIAPGDVPALIGSGAHGSRT